MEFSYLFYPPHWKKKAWRRQVLSAAGNKCQMCGVTNRTIASNANEEPFMIYLQIAHKDQYLTWHPQAETLVLCQPCHRKFDQQNQRRDRADFTISLIGQARISAVYKRRTYLVGVVSTLNELCPTTFLTGFSNALISPQNEISGGFHPERPIPRSPLFFCFS